MWLHYHTHGEEVLVIVQGLYQARRFPSDVFNPSPQEAANFPMREVCPQIGPFVPLKRELPPTITHFFFLLEVVLIRGIGISDLGNSFGVDHHPHHPLTGSPHLEPWHLLQRGTWGGQGRQGGGLPVTLSMGFPPFTHFL